MLFEIFAFIAIRHTVLQPQGENYFRFNEKLTSEQQEVLKSIFSDNEILTKGISRAAPLLFEIINRFKRHLNLCVYLGIIQNVEDGLPIELQNIEFTLFEITLDYVKKHQQSLQNKSLPETIQAKITKPPSIVRLYAVSNSNVDFDYMTLNNFIAMLNDLSEEDEIKKKENNLKLLHFLLSYGSANLVKHFLNQRADINNNDSEDNTALHLAAKNKDISVLNFILSQEKYSNENLKSKNEQGDTALNLAAEGNFPAFKLLLSKGADIRTKNNKNQSPLHKAASAACFPIVEICHQYNLEINEKDNTNKTPLHWALIYLRCINGNLKVKKQNELKKIIYFLLDNNAVIDEDVKTFIFDNSYRVRVGDTYKSKKNISHLINHPRITEIITVGDIYTSKLPSSFIWATRNSGIPSLFGLGAIGYYGMAKGEENFLNLSLLGIILIFSGFGIKDLPIRHFNIPTIKCPSIFSFFKNTNKTNNKKVKQMLSNSSPAHRRP